MKICSFSVSEIPEPLSSISIKTCFSFSYSEIPKNLPSEPYFIALSIKFLSIRCNASVSTFAYIGLSSILTSTLKFSLSSKS